MKISQNGIDLIKEFEGCRLEAYKCPAGIWTIGYGHIAGVEKGQKITKAQAENLLKQDLQRFENGVNNLVKVKLTQGQFDALVSFAFNCGVEALKKSTLLKVLNQGKYDEAADEFDKWVYAGMIKLNGLVRRRRAEKEMFLQRLIIDRYKVTATGLNVRSGPGTNYKRIKVAYYNTIVEISDTVDNWGKLANEAGWVCTDYLQKI